MPRRAGAARIIPLVLVVVLSSACDRAAETPLGSAGSPSNDPARSAEPGVRATPSVDPIRAELDSKVIQPLASALEKGDEGLLPALKPGLEKSSRGLITDALARSKEFGVERVSLADEKTYRLSRGTNVLKTSGTYRLKGIPADIPFSLSIHVDPVGNDRWHITAFYWGRAPLWSGEEPVRRTATSAALIFHPPGFNAAELGQMVVEARTGLAQSLPEIRSNSYLVFVAPTRSDFSRAEGRGAATVLSQHRLIGREFETAEPLLVIDFDNWQDMSDTSRRSLVLHEITHAILAPYTSPLVPDWLNEGIAVHFSKDPGLEIFRQELERLDKETVRGVARTDRMVGYFREDGAVNYAIAGAAVSYLAERFGEKAVLDFMQSFIAKATDEELKEIATTNYIGGYPIWTRDLWAELSNRLLLESFGIDFDELDVRTKEWIRARL